MQLSCRTWLIAALSGTSLPFKLNAANAHALAANADDEGVLLLLLHAFNQHPQRQQMDAEVLCIIEHAARPALMAQLAMLAEQRKALEALKASGKPFLVLKGGALGHWLYADPSLRLITDLDVLVSDRTELTVLLVEFSKLEYQLNASAGSRVGLQQALMKAGGPYGEFSVDVHWQLFNSMQFQNCFSFNELYESAIEYLPGVRGLSPVHALVHACMHRALNLPFRYAEGVQRANCLRWLWDIHLLAASLSESQWRQLCQLSEAKRISAPLVDGLDAAALECQSPIPIFVFETLHQQKTMQGLTMRPFQSWLAYQWHEFQASADSFFGRLQWLKQRLLPNAEAMRARYGHDGDSGWRILWRRFDIGLRRMFGVK